MPYVYRHVRLDKNEVFYIGIGMIDNDDYKRSRSKSGRNKMWWGIFKKSKIEIEIVITDIPAHMIFDKEKEFIALYKRKSHGGTLVNLTDGGEGTNGVFVSIETRSRQRMARIGKSPWNKGMKMPEEFGRKVSVKKLGKTNWRKGTKLSEEERIKLKERLKGKHLSGSDHPMYGTKMPAHVKEKLREANINRPPWNKGIKYNKELSVKYADKNRMQQKIVMQFNLNWELVGVYESVTIAAKQTGIPKSSIAKCASGEWEKAKGFTWEYGNSQINPLKNEL